MLEGGGGGWRSATIMAILNIRCNYYNTTTQICVTRKEEGLKIALKA